MKVLVVEDSRLAREGLVRMLKEFPELEIAGQADNIHVALELILEHQPEVIFLDIQMPGGSGFELLEKLSYLPKIIFTTAYSEYAIQSFDFNTVDYLLKPISQQRLNIAINKLLGNQDSGGQPHSATADQSETDLDIKKESKKLPLELNSKIFIKDGERCYLIKLESICYIESQKNYVQIFFEGQKAFVKKSLNLIEERLPQSMFFRISRQHIVNLQEIQKIEESIGDGYTILMSDGKELEVSRRNASALKELLSF